MQPEDARVQVGPFELAGRLGEGAMGRVYAGTHLRSSFPVAVKFMANPGHHEAFAHEIQAVAALDHPHVVWVLDHGVTHEGVPWLAMQRATGTLVDEIGAPWSRVRRALFYLLDALAHAHARGVVHGDLKPANVLLGCRRDLQAPLRDAIEGLALADFGLARTGLGGPSGGTPGFMPPEQAHDGTVGPWSDLYAVGCTAWMLLTGVAPSPGGSLQADQPVPPGLTAWLARLLAPDPTERFARAAHALAALSRLPAIEDRAVSSVIVPQTAQLSTQAVLAPVDAVVLPAEASPLPVDDVLPVPASWRRHQPSWPAIAMVDAGLALTDYRTLPLVGRIEARDTLWGALRQVAETGRAHAVQLSGPTGSGRSRLARWLARRAHELGVAEVTEDAPRADHEGLQVVLVERPRVAAAVEVARHLARQPLEAQPVLWVLAGGAELGEMDRASIVELGPLPVREHEALVRAALPLEPGLSLDVAEVTQGMPGAVVDVVRQLVHRDALVASRDGFVLRDGAALPGRVPPPRPADPSAQLEAWLAEVRERRHLGDRRGAGRVGRRAWALAEQVGEGVPERLRVAAMAAQVAGGRGTMSPEAFSSTIDAIIARSVAGGFAAVEAEARIQRALLLNEGPDTREASTAELRRATETALEHEAWEVAVKASYQLGYNLMFAGDLDGSEALFRQCLALEPHAGPIGAHFGGMGLCDLMLRRGRPDEALACAHQAVQVQFPGRVFEASGTLGCLLIDLDRLDEAKEWIGRAIRQSRELGSLGYEAQMRLNQGCICEQRGELDEAESEFLQAIGLARLTGRSDRLMRLNLASVYVQQARYVESLQVLAPLGGAPTGRPSVDLYEGLVRAVAQLGAGTLDDPHAALTACEQAAAAMVEQSPTCVLVTERLVEMLADSPWAPRAEALLAAQRGLEGHSNGGPI